MDDTDLTLFLVKDPARAQHASCVLTFQVDDVDAQHRQLDTALSRLPYPGALVLPDVLMRVAALVSGGVGGVFRK